MNQAQTLPQSPETAMKTATVVLLTIAGALSACKASDPPPAKERAQTEAEKTVYDTQFKALQKAKDVQNVVDQQKATSDKQLQDAEGGH
jgi:hypothetical protein